MGWFRNLGLQRRIMLYVAVGLALMFAVGAYLSVLSIRRMSELVDQERLGSATATATILSNALQQMANHTTSVHGQQFLDASPEEFEELQLTSVTLLAHLSHGLPFVRAQGIRLLDPSDQVRFALANQAEAPHMLPQMEDSGDFADPTLLSPSPSSGNPYFGTLLVPIMDAEGTLRWTVALDLAALNDVAPYFLSSRSTEQAANTTEDPPNSYRLEVVDATGQVALTRGGHTPVGELSPHFPILQEQASQGSSPTVFIHKPRKDQSFQPHMIAAVPLAYGSYVVMLEQQTDVALGLPLVLRRQLFWFAGLGFLATLAVAWVTTRHVVKPTEQLTLAAQRIAQGEVGSPITVMAQDETGRLAESLETMRLRLQAWGSDLEAQVRKRTAELEESNRETRLLYQELQQKEAQLRALFAKVLSAQEEERRRVSRELHDGMGQAISAISMGLERLERGMPAEWRQLREDAQTLEELAKETIGDLRRLTIALRPAALDDLGLVPAIRRYGELFLGAAGVDFAVQDERVKTQLDSPAETVIYRVVQEAINNIARHSKATRARVWLQSTNGGLTVTVEDNGQGFDPTLPSTSPGVGLLGMEERASLAGGKLTVDGQPGHGTTVLLDIPLAEATSTQGNG